MSDDVIDFDKAKRQLEGGPTSIEFRRRKHTDRPSCHHQNAYVCEEDRSLECQECGATMDPFDFIKKFASGQRTLSYTREEIAEGNKKLNRMKRDEHNTKARLNRLKGKLPAGDKEYTEVLLVLSDYGFKPGERDHVPHVLKWWLKRSALPDPPKEPL